MSPEAGSSVFIAGWGETVEGGSQSQFLKEAKIPVVNTTECNDLYSGAVNEETMFCAGFAHGGIDSCQGDSGGPLIVLSEDKPIAAGIISWGVVKGSKNFYAH